MNRPVLSFHDYYQVVIHNFLIVTKLVDTLVYQVLEEQLNDYKEIVKLCCRDHR